MPDLPELGIDPLPDIDLRQMLVLTDETGILQHAKYATPDLHHGYCTDDNCRALLAAVKYFALEDEARDSSYTRDDLLTATQRYLAFLAYAFNPETGRFRNFMEYDRNWLEEIGSEDSHARTLWGLGSAARLGPTADVRDYAEELYLRALGAANSFGHLRPRAYTLLGIYEYLQARPDHEQSLQLKTRLAEDLLEVYRENATDDWPWWEDRLSWGNTKLPHALLVSGEKLKREEMIEAGLTSLRWVLDVQTGEEGQLSIIGNRGWYVRGQERARFDQQPIEAKGGVQACLSAAVITGDPYWTAEAKRCFEWFLGRNNAGVPLYNPETGGCQDGLSLSGVSSNQGAESTLAYLLTVLELRHYARGRRVSRETPPRRKAAGPPTPLRGTPPRN